MASSAHACKGLLNPQLPHSAAVVCLPSHIAQIAATAQPQLQATWNDNQNISVRRLDLGSENAQGTSCGRHTRAASSAAGKHASAAQDLRGHNQLQGNRKWNQQQTITKQQHAMPFAAAAVIDLLRCAPEQGRQGRQQQGRCSWQQHERAHTP